MNNFAYEAPGDLRRAVELLARMGGEALPLAGGTDLLPRLKEGDRAPTLLVDLSGLEELQGIELLERGLRLGSLVTHAQVAGSDLVRKHAPAVARASASVGAVQTRNLGSLGGNLAAGVPSMDGAPALLALEARVVVSGPEGEVELPLQGFFLGPQQTILKPGQLLKEILIPRTNLGKPCAFGKFGRRKALSLALVNAAVSLRLDTQGRVMEPCVALGAVAPTPIRAPQTEAYLAGRSAGDEETLRRAASLAATETQPLDDFRASADYRRSLVEVLVKRLLKEAAIRAAAGTEQ